MSWFYVTLASAFLWSISSHIEKFQVDTYYQRARAGSLMFLTSILGLILATVIFLFKPSLAHIPLQSALVIILAGVAYFIGVFPYLFALKREEASRAIPLLQTQPVFSYILAFLFLHETIAAHQLLAGLLIVVAAILINLDSDNKFRLKKTVFFLMMASTALFAINAFLFKFVARDVGFWSGVLYQDIGVFLSGVVLFSISAGYRRDFINIFVKNRRAVMTIGVVDEAIALTARILFNYATLLAPLALVTVISGFQPVFVLLLGIIITIFWPKFGRESLLRKHLAQKAFSIALFFIGTYLLFK